MAQNDRHLSVHSTPTEVTVVVVIPSCGLSLLYKRRFKDGPLDWRMQRHRVSAFLFSGGCGVPRCTASHVR